MPDSETGSRAFSIEHRQRLLVKTDGHADETSEIFVKVYRDMALSGLLAELSGNELKVLLVLGLEAKVLGGDAEAERHFERLRALDVVTSADRGRLLCYLDRETIAGRTGLSTRTVSTAGSALVSKQLIEKRSVRNHSGQHDYNIYFIRPASHLGKFDFNQRRFHDTQQQEPHHGKNLPMVEAMSKEPPAVGFPYVKKGRSTGGNGQDLDSLVFTRFAERQNAGHYEPAERDVFGLAQARDEGYTQEEILAAVDEAFDKRSTGTDPIRHFTYCLPILRSRQPSSQQPQPVPSGSPVGTQQTEKDTGDDPQTTAAPAVAPPTGDGAEVIVADEWEIAMERAYQKVRKAGWPISETLQTALRAKAVRVDDVARQQEADGPSWAADAMLLALGRKMGRNGSRTPRDEELLAYADGILANWAQKGRPRARERRNRPAHQSARQVQPTKIGNPNYRRATSCCGSPSQRKRSFGSKFWASCSCR